MKHPNYYKLKLDDFTLKQIELQKKFEEILEKNKETISKIRELILNI